MSHQPPDIDTITYKASDKSPGRFDLDVVWSIPGPDSIIPGDRPDVFRILVNGTLFREVDQNQTTTTIPGLSPGTYVLSVCCEWKPNDHTADEKCSSVSLPVSSQSPSGSQGGPPTPRLAVVARQPRLLNRRNQVTISWSSYSFNDGDIYWGQLGQPLTRHQSIRPQSDNDYHGQYTTDVETLSSARYQFRVQVKNSLTTNTWVSSDLVVTASENFRSVRRFLTASGVPANTGIRGILRSAKTSSLKEMMGFGHTIP